jgi:hypothetical protein
MSSTVNSALYGVERQALAVLDKEIQRYHESQTLTPSLVQLMKNTHEMVLKGAKQRGGIATDGKSPREILVELEQLVVEFREIVQQENELSVEGSLQ